MDIIERAARAVCIAHGHEPEGMKFSDGQPIWTAYIDDARAVLSALREPDEGMIEAGWSCFPDYEPSAQDATDCWQAMIDQALKG
jgi:hypothetical protein